MYYLGFWEKADGVSVEDFEKKMRKFIQHPRGGYEAFSRNILDQFAYAGEFKGIEVIEVRGKGSDKVLIGRMEGLRPEVEIRWVPIIKLSRMLNLDSNLVNL
jgi:hypothetical protein